MRRDPKTSSDEVERRLRDSLAAFSESVAGEPPDAAALLRLVDDVKRAERRREVRELMQFLACAVVVVSGGLLLLTRTPQYYAVLQAILAVPAAIGALIWSGRRRQVTE